MSPGVSLCPSIAYNRVVNCDSPRLGGSGSSWLRISTCTQTQHSTSIRPNANKQHLRERTGYRAARKGHYEWIYKRRTNEYANLHLLLHPGNIFQDREARLRLSNVLQRRSPGCPAGACRPRHASRQNGTNGMTSASSSHSRCVPVHTELALNIAETKLFLPNLISAKSTSKMLEI